MGNYVLLAYLLESILKLLIEDGELKCIQLYRRSRDSVVGIATANGVGD
jgi:hypothetical protein